MRSSVKIIVLIGKLILLCIGVFIICSVFSYFGIDSNLYESSISNNFVFIFGLAILVFFALILSRSKIEIVSDEQIEWEKNINLHISDSSEQFFKDIISKEKFVFNFYNTENTEIDSINSDMYCPHCRYKGAVSKKGLFKTSCFCYNCNSHWEF